MAVPETFLDGRVTVWSGDCREVLAELAENSIDAVCCDPPYHLTSIVKRFGAEGAALAKVGKTGAYARSSAGFMGKVWDGGDIAFQPETWAAVLRVMKPGAHLVAFGGSRTAHRLATAIEDAGFEIRDCLVWLFGQGFPKSLNVSKKLEDFLHADARCACGIDYPGTVLGSQSDCLSYRDSHDVRPHDEKDTFQGASPSQDDAQGHSPSSGPQDVQDKGWPHSHCTSFDLPSSGRSLRQLGLRSEDFRLNGNTLSGNQENTSPYEERAERRTASHKSDMTHSGDDWAASSLHTPLKYENLPRCPTCGKVKIASGLGTSLKPAMEMIYLARRPLSEPTIAANVLRWGCGALNISACRIDTGSEDRSARYNGKAPGGGETVFSANRQDKPWEAPPGRWPANLCHDGSDEVLAGFPETTSGQLLTSHTLRESNNLSMSGKNYTRNPRNDAGGDSGSAARFFYTSKADAADRIGSKHPTVKPVDLMQWLCRLITPPGGTILDPFSGTGTTAEAAYREGFSAVLIEREEEYLADIRRRMALILAGPEERTREITKARGKTEPPETMALFGGQT